MEYEIRRQGKTLRYEEDGDGLEAQVRFKSPMHEGGTVRETLSNGNYVDKTEILVSDVLMGFLYEARQKHGKFIQEYFVPLNTNDRHRRKQ